MPLAGSHGHVQREQLAMSAFQVDARPTTAVPDMVKLVLGVPSGDVGGSAMSRGRRKGRDQCCWW